MTIERITTEELALVEHDVMSALRMASSMLCNIRQGNQYDSSDFIRREVAIESVVLRAKLFRLINL